MVSINNRYGGGLLYFLLLAAKLPHVSVVFLSVGRPPSPNPSLNLTLVLRVILPLIPSVVLQLWIKGSCNSM